MDENLAGCIKVFGSATVQVSPDRVAIELEVSRSGPAPSDAFAHANAASAEVLRFLRAHQIDEIRSSRITLNQASEWGPTGADGQRHKIENYTARIGHRVLSGDLDGVETLLSGAIEAGANELRSVQFLSSQLQEIRQQARRSAVQAARAKAELYAEAAGTEIGNVHAIEDVNPDGGPVQRRSRASAGAGENAGGSHDPGMIEVVGRVNVYYRIAESS